VPELFRAEDGFSPPRFSAPVAGRLHCLCCCCCCCCCRCCCRCCCCAIAAAAAADVISTLVRGPTPGKKSKLCCVQAARDRRADFRKRGKSPGPDRVRRAPGTI